MIAGHGEPCGASEAQYCMNGGTCLKIPSVTNPSVTNPTCICKDLFEGSRCDQLQLLVVSSNPERAGLIAAIAIVGLLLLVILAVVIYYACEMWRRKPKSSQNRIEYWKVSPRV